MAAPAARYPLESVWLSPADVKEWLRVAGEDTTDDAVIAAAVAMAEPYAQRCRPEWMLPDPDNPGQQLYQPDAETYQGAVMYAAREFRRRNSPAGVEAFGDVTSYVSRWDPDIDRALQTGSYARPVTA